MEFFKKISEKLKTKIKKIDKYIILRVDGGLGSVILQYALGENIKKCTGEKVKYDATWFEGKHLTCDKKLTHELTIKELFPNIDFELATKKELKFYKKYHSYTNSKTWEYNEEIFKIKAPRYLDGYYSHYKYWYNMENELQKNLDFSTFDFDENNKNMIKKINNSENSVAIHIRRGDFVSLGWCCLGKDYYINAIKYLQNKLNKNLDLFFFSNDMEYVQNEIMPYIENSNCILVDINDHYHGYVDMYLMSLCKHQIVANSTFSITSALLNKNKEKMVIAPNTWGYNIGKEDAKDIKYSGIEDSIQNPHWISLHYETGNVVNIDKTAKNVAAVERERE